MNEAAAQSKASGAAASNYETAGKFKEKTPLLMDEESKQQKPHAVEMEFDGDKNGSKSGNYQSNSSGRPGEELNDLKRRIDGLMSEFDLSGDRHLSPEEFFNVIMTLYE